MKRKQKPGCTTSQSRSCGKWTPGFAQTHDNCLFFKVLEAMLGQTACFGVSRATHYAKSNNKVSALGKDEASSPKYSGKKPVIQSMGVRIEIESILHLVQSKEHG